MKELSIHYRNSQHFYYSNHKSVCFTCILVPNIETRHGFLFWYPGFNRSGLMSKSRYSYFKPKVSLLFYWANVTCKWKLLWGTFTWTKRIEFILWRDCLLTFEKHRMWLPFAISSSPILLYTFKKAQPRNPFLVDRVSQPQDFYHACLRDKALLLT